MEPVGVSNAPSPVAGSSVPCPAGSQPTTPNPRGLPQLPPQMFTTAAQLLDLTDKNLLVTLRDGRKFFGILRSWDQFANLILQCTTERIYVSATTPEPSNSTSQLPSFSEPRRRGFYADIPRGLFVVRGESVVLLGELDPEEDNIPPPAYERTDPAVVYQLFREQQAAERARDRGRLRRLNALGFEAESCGEVLF